MAEVKTVYTGDATSLVAATEQAQAGVNGVLKVTVQANETLGKLRMASDLASKGSAALASASTVLAGGLGSVTAAIKAQTMAALANPIMAGIVVGITACAAAYTYFSSELEAANAQVEESSKAAADAQKVFGDFTSLLGKIGDDYAVATGKMSKADLDLKKKQEELTASYTAAVKKNVELGLSTNGLTERYLAARAELEATAKAQKDGSGSTKGHTIAIKDNTDAVREAAKAQKDYYELVRKNAKSDEDRLGDAQKLIDSVRDAGLSEREQLVESARARDAEFAAQIRRAKEIGASTSELEEARVEARKQSTEKIKEFDAEEVKSTQEKNAQIAQDNAKASNEAIQQAATVTDAVIGLADQLLQNKLSSIDTSTKAGKEEAKKIWETQKGLAIARAVLDAVAAVSAASTLVPPASYIAMGVAAATGAINIAAVAAAPPPKFHKGGVLMPDEKAATLQTGEAVLSRQGRAMLGDDAIQAANAGRSSGGAAVQQFVYKHKVFNYFVEDNIGLDGPLARNMRRGDRVGQLRRGRA